MLYPPPKTGDSSLDRFLTSVYDQSIELEARVRPDEGWSLTDFTAEVSGVIGDKRDLIDIVTQYDSIEDYLDLIQDQRELLQDALDKIESIDVSADWFATIMEWWDQNYRIIMDAQESLQYKREADEAALEAKGHSEDSKRFRDTALQHRDGAKSEREAAAEEKLKAEGHRIGAENAHQAAEGVQTEVEDLRAETETLQGLARDYRDGAKAHREAAGLSEDNAASHDASASTSANTASQRAASALEHLNATLSAKEDVEAVETTLRALLADTAAWQEVQTALSHVDTVAADAMAQVKDEILGGVGPAFDTLLELAEALGENADAIGTLTNELAKKADKGHTHDARALDGVSQAVEPNMIVQRFEDGGIQVPEPTYGSDPATVNYVNKETAKKSDTGHTHTIADVSGLQKALDAKSPISHIHSISEIDGLEAQLEGKSSTGHKHVSADITDAYYFTGGTMKDRVVKTYSDGHIFSASDPSRSEHLARKGYVDSKAEEIAGIKAAEVIDITSDDADLNEYLTTGRYIQRSNARATSGANYPHGRAGVLEVVDDSGAFTYQRYTTDMNGDTWTRSRYNDTWYAWQKLTTEGHGHEISDVAGLQAALNDAAGAATWSELQGKPSTFPPSTHSHSWSQITGKPSTFAPSTHTHSWSQITSKPSTFSPSSHDHDWSELRGRPYTDHGYNNKTADDPAQSYPDGVTYIMSNGVSNGWNSVIPGPSSSFVMVLTMKNGTYSGSTTQLAFSYNDVSRPIYMRKWDHNTSEWLPFHGVSDHRPAAWVHEGGVFQLPAGAAEGDTVFNLETMQIHKIVNGGI